MLLSFVNTQLRDFYPNLHDFCESNSLDQAELEKKLAMIDYQYDAQRNQFI